MAEEQEGDSLLWGRHAVAEALATGHPVNRVYLARQAHGDQIDQIKELARQRQVRFDFVEVGRLGALTGTRDHQDVVARLSPVAYAALDELLRRLAERPASTLVALDRLQHPGNVGMVIRTAVGAGADGLLLPTRGGRLVTGEVVRAAAGTVFRLPIVSSGNLPRDLLHLKSLGYWVYGLDGQGQTSLYEVDWPARCVLVAGHETTGLRPLVRRTADALVRIPLAGGLDSLNVGVAVGVALFELSRRRGPTAGPAAPAAARRAGSSPQTTNAPGR